MTDGLDLFDELSDDRPTRGRSRRPVPSGRRSAGRRRTKWIIVLGLVVVIGVGAYLGVLQLLGFGFYPDYTGSGGSDVVFEVNSGDSVRDIGNNLQHAGVVASANAFVKASKSNDAVGNVQPGFYVMKTKMSGAAAVDKMVSPHSRVGQLEIRSGWQLDDTTSVDGKVAPGILTHIAQATCMTLNGRSTCISVADLRTAIEKTDPAALGVPSWAVPSVAAADPKRRLEGLILPGQYNLRPGDTPVQTLRAILEQSSAQLQAAGLPSASQQNSGFSPYQVLVMASIVERESGTQADMPKIARVLYNRLANGTKLQLDSTVDYALDRPMVATSPAERPGAGPYDTYDNIGLPPTPISSPSNAAIEAASQPAAGPWMYFVVCQKDRSSCFAVTFPDHQKNVALAHTNGVF